MVYVDDVVVDDPYKELYEKLEGMDLDSPEAQKLMEEYAAKMADVSLFCTQPTHFVPYTLATLTLQMVDYDSDNIVSPTDLAFVTTYLTDRADKQSWMDAMSSSKRPILSAYP